MTHTTRTLFSDPFSKCFRKGIQTFANISDFEAFQTLSRKIKVDIDKFWLHALSNKFLKLLRKKLRNDTNSILFSVKRYNNKTCISVNLGFFSAKTSSDRQNFDMMQSQLFFIDCFTAS